MCEEEREFMLAWNAFTREHAVYADEDMAERCIAFAEAHAARAAGDAAFRQCLVTHLHSMWSFRLLAPEHVEYALEAVAQARQGTG